MKKIKLNLYRQLLSIVFGLFIIIFISLGIFLPKVLLPIYEKNLYQYLRQPLDLVKYDVDNQALDTEVAYLYYKRDGMMVVSENFEDVVPISPKEVIDKTNDDGYGKFKYNGKTYYYNSSMMQGVLKLSITSDDYINQIRRDLVNTIFPIISITFLIITVIVIWWSRRLIRKINHLKEKVDNLDNDKYVDKMKFNVDDEMYDLSEAIDNMKITLQKQEEYKNQMYQNISHDFKTPLTVIKSYMEAFEDGIESAENTRKIVKEEVNKLEGKVHSLLYLNKLSYISDTNNIKDEKTDITGLLNDCIKKLKIQRPDINFKIYLKGDSSTYNGSYDMWEAIIYNILNNFMRYVDKKIEITLKNDNIIMYNDGPNIDENILNDIFTPYKKGINGQFGLGLSIVKKTLMLCGYEITVKNEKKGISFVINKL